MRYDTVIFDLDGTLLNSLDDLAASVNYALKECNYPLRTTEEVRTFIGNGVSVLMRRAIPKEATDAEHSKALEIFKNYYAHNSTNRTRPYDGVLELLGELKSKGCSLAIVSNKIDFAVKDLCKEFFDRYIDVAVGDSDDTENKPAPDMVYKALDMLGKSRDRAVYIGDTDVDLQTAQNSGMDCISVSWGYRSHNELEGYGAQMIADNPCDVLEYIKK